MRSDGICENNVLVMNYKTLEYRKYGERWSWMHTETAARAKSCVTRVLLITVGIFCWVPVVHWFYILRSNMVTLLHTSVENTRYWLHSIAISSYCVYISISVKSADSTILDIHHRVLPILYFPCSFTWNKFEMSSH